MRSFKIYIAITLTLIMLILAAQLVVSVYEGIKVKDVSSNLSQKVNSFNKSVSSINSDLQQVNSQLEKQNDLIKTSLP